MGPSQKLVWNLYAGVVGALTTIVAQKAVRGAWKFATGQEPPEPNDPETPLTEALIWALASGIGIGVTQLLVNRLAAQRWQAAMGTPAPRVNKVAFTI
jgi:hypothetical protein